MYRKSTLRKLSHTTRKMAKLLNEAEITILKLKKLLPLIEGMETTETAMLKASEVIQSVRGEVKLGMANLHDGKELFPLEVTDISLAVRPSERDSIAEHRDCSFCNKTQGNDECRTCLFEPKEKTL